MQDPPLGLPYFTCFSQEFEFWPLCEREADVFGSRNGQKIVFGSVPVFPIHLKPNSSLVVRLNAVRDRFGYDGLADEFSETVSYMLDSLVDPAFPLFATLETVREQLLDHPNAQTYFDQHWDEICTVLSRDVFVQGLW